VSVATRYAGAGVRRKIIARDEPAWLTRHKRADYVRCAYLARPEWVDREEMRWLEWCRRSWSSATGVEHVLDHVIPLNHPQVCGLTVPWNLALVPRAVNANKRNEWHPLQESML
jgi:hypothetical protein